MAHSAPGKSDREGITVLELADMFPDEAAARAWFERHIWPDGERHCPHCGSTRTHEASGANSPYRCSDCRGYFSVKTGTIMDNSRLPLRKWVFAIYLEMTSLKGVSSHETPPRHRRHSEISLVHAPPYSGSVVTWRALAVLRPRRNRRNLFRRQGEEQARQQEAQGRSRHGWQSRRCWGEGSKN